MTRHRALMWIVFLVLIMLAGFIIFTIKTEGSAAVNGMDFRIWLWENRTTDLFIQVALIFAGVLGVVIILNSGKEDPK